MMAMEIGKRATPPPGFPLPRGVSRRLEPAAGRPLATDGRAGMPASVGRHSQRTGGEHLYVGPEGGAVPRNDHNSRSKKGSKTSNVHGPFMACMLGLRTRIKSTASGSDAGVQH